MIKPDEYLGRSLRGIGSLKSLEGSLEDSLETPLEFSLENSLRGSLGASHWNSLGLLLSGTIRREIDDQAR